MQVKSPRVKPTHGARKFVPRFVPGGRGWEIIRKTKTQVYKPNLGHPKLFPTIF